MPSPIHHLVQKKKPFLQKVPTLRERILAYGEANKYPHIGFGGCWPNGNVRYIIGVQSENAEDRRMIWELMVGFYSDEAVNALADAVGIAREAQAS